MPGEVYSDLIGLYLLNGDLMKSPSKVIFMIKRNYK